MSKPARNGSAYGEKFKDPRWQKLRLETLQAFDFICQTCGDTKSTLNVHHVNYRKGAEPWEYQRSDLTVLCERCHEDIEKMVIPKLRALAVILPPDVTLKLCNLLEGAAHVSLSIAGTEARAGDVLRAALERSRANEVISDLSRGGYLRVGLEVGDLCDMAITIEESSK